MSRLSLTTRSLGILACLGCLFAWQVSVLAEERKIWDHRLRSEEWMSGFTSGLSTSPAAARFLLIDELEKRGYLFVAEEPSNYPLKNPATRLYLYYPSTVPGADNFCSIDVGLTKNSDGDISFSMNCFRDSLTFRVITPPFISEVAGVPIAALRKVEQRGEQELIKDEQILEQNQRQQPNMETLALYVIAEIRHGSESDYQRAVSLFEQDSSRWTAQLITCLRHVASLQAHTRSPEAEVVYRRALAYTDHQFSLEAIRAEILSELASLYANSGRLEEASKLFQDALTMAERSLGVDDKDVRLFRARLASWKKNLIEQEREIEHPQ